MDAIVPHITHPAEYNALRKMVWTPGIPGTELTQDRNQRIAYQRINLVDEHHQRRGMVCRPAVQHLPEDAIWPVLAQGLIPYVIDKAIVEDHTGACGQFSTNGLHGCSHIFTRCLPYLHVHIHTAVRPLRIQIIHQRQ